MQCLTPFVKRDDETETPLPCGKCPPCKQRRINGWVFRLQQQEKISHSSNFITLTYDTKYLPILPNAQTTVDKTHLQLFFKRLRKVNYDKIKYYACGEYGTKTNRPHYHVIMFNHQIETIPKAWGLGHCRLDPVNEATIRYTLKYINKPDRIPMWDGDQRNKEFQLMSKGLGANYITQSTIEWHNNDKENRLYIPDKDNIRIPMPRYYKNKIYHPEELEYINYKILQKHKDNFKPLTEKQERAKLAAISQLFNQQHQKSQSNEF